MPFSDISHSQHAGKKRRHNRNFQTSRKTLWAPQRAACQKRKKTEVLKRRRRWLLHCTTAAATHNTTVLPSRTATSTTHTSTQLLYSQFFFSPCRPETLWSSAFLFFELHPVYMYFEISARVILHYHFPSFLKPAALSGTRYFNILLHKNASPLSGPRT